ncbi:MAG: dTDP-4-dehydrorhamnose reductase [Verrucomicrobiota bacterium]
MNVVVIGCNGMLGTDLVRACRQEGFETQGFDLPTMDITNFKNVGELMPKADWVVNCAAYTRVDDAEADREQAFAVNAEGAYAVARVCAKNKLKLMHISTDYIFDGRLTRPYDERDRPNPLGVYGASKLAGEKAVRAEGGSFLVVRTQSLFGARGANFVKTIVQRLRQSDEPLRVVGDQVSSPTYTRHLAEALVLLMKLGKEGIVHVAASGSCSWFEFAQAIAARVKPDAVVEALASADLARPAPRPAYSVLDTKLYRSWTGQAMPHWQKGLEEYLAEEKFV